MFERLIEEALISGHRRLIVLQGSREKALEVAEYWIKRARDRGFGKKVLFLGEFAINDEEYVEMFRGFRRKLHGFSVTALPFPKHSEALGRTFDFLVFDAHDSLPPNALASSFGAVRGPGLIFLLLPDDFPSMTMVLHEIILTPPYTQVRKLFLKRVERKLEEHGIPVYHVDREEWIRPPEKVTVKMVKREFEARGKIHRLCATKDQLGLVESVENISDVVVVTAARGRGKSSGIGLGIVALARKEVKSKKDRLRIVVTAPNYENADEIFNFVKVALKVLKIPFSTTPRSLSCPLFYMEYLLPPEAVHHRSDLLVVDEAAAIPISILRKLLAHPRIIFSTTTQGYEGTGRVFQVRFLPYLMKKRRVKLVELEEPIRFAPGDPVEKFVYDLLVLDAEYPEIKKLGPLKFREIDVEELAFNDRLLRQFFGIYVFAHYRNSPQDLLILLDAPNQRAFAVFSGDKVVAALQVAEEGGLDRDIMKRFLSGEKIQGNIIPDIFLKYYGEKGPAERKGLRIVRIAVHPELQGRGIGSFALRSLESWAKDREYSYIGAVFGLTRELYNFWLKNGYTLYHISPIRNPETGEYSALVLRPLDISLPDVRGSIYSKVLYELPGLYYHMEPEVVVSILEGGYKYPFVLLPGDRERISGFLSGVLKYEAVSDIAYRTCVSYFMEGNFLGISEKNLLAVVEKVLKKKSWKNAAQYLETDEEVLWDRVHRVLKKLFRHYYRNAAQVQEEVEGEDKEGGEDIHDKGENQA